MNEPIFKQIKSFVKQNIINQHYTLNDKIPTEDEIAKQFKTTRQTVNKALGQLVIEGFIKRFPRSGSFVCYQKPQTSILELRSIVSEVKSRGNQYSNQVITLEEIKADKSVAVSMGLVTDQKIFFSQIIHKENDVPIRFDRRFINPLCCPRYIEQDFSKISPNEYLQKHCPAQRVENIIEAITNTPEILTFLDIQEHEPCLLISRLVFFKDQVASYSKLYYPSSRYKLCSISEPTL